MTATQHFLHIPTRPDIQVRGEREEEYVGEWRSGLMEGDGTYRWPDGESYEGEWREGKRYGEGINNYAPGANPSPFYDGYWNYDKVVDDYPNSIYAGH